jgi:hypothetical protein
MVMELDFSDVLSSRAKFKVLKLLFQCSAPISLRTITDLTVLPVRSVALALDNLLEQKIIKDSRRDKRRFFQTNHRHPLYEELKNIFVEVERSEIRIKSPQYQREATRAFKFAESANRFFSAVK